MSPTWSQRKVRLAVLLKSRENEDEDALALDRLLHGQSVIGKTAKTTEVDSIRFQDKDLALVGTLEYGQFGVIDVVNCNLDGRVYVRKSTEKRFALRTRDQCSPQFERDILLQATKEKSQWCPHLLCAFQTQTHLNLVMTYAEGGNLWDILESSPHDGRVLETDLRWWTPQIVSAIHWCHSQGFAHRDIKPHNFVLTPDAHILLIDFGSAAPLLPPEPDGSQKLLKRYCLVPCGTCDYISPEILQAHEKALVAMEMEDEDDQLEFPLDAQGYGLETDWWSLGAMLYEMVYGVAPFFAEDIRQTYTKIMDHERSLRFLKSVNVSSNYQDLLKRLLTNPNDRLGRKNVMEITEHPFFDDIDWSILATATAPAGLHLPVFTYAEPAPVNVHMNTSQSDQSHSQGFAFSALFQSSKASSPGASSQQESPAHSALSRSISRDETLTSFIGFSWGPTADAFPETKVQQPSRLSLSPADIQNTPRPNRYPSLSRTTPSGFLAPHSFTPGSYGHAFMTPNRHSSMLPHGTLRASTVRRTGPRRAVSDREAMKQLVDCIGMSARKIVLESGRKPRTTMSFGSLSRSGPILMGDLKKELRFLPSPLDVRDYASSSQAQRAPVLAVSMSSDDISTTDESDGPPSPSPSPRPGSAMSRRSGTPTLTMTGTTTTGTFSQRSGSGLFPPRPGSALRFAEFGMDSRLESQDGSSNSAVVSRSVVQPLSEFDALEERHKFIMENLFDIQQRLNAFSATLVDVG